MAECPATNISPPMPLALTPTPTWMLTIIILAVRLGSVTQPSSILRDLHVRIETALKRAAPAWLRPKTDDMAQAAVVKLMRQGRSEEALAALKPAYLWRAAHSEIMDEIRRCRRRGEVGLQEASGLADTSRPDAEQVVAGKFIGDAIRTCLGLLVDSRRRAVALYLVGHTVPEVAILLGISKKQAENLVFRGLRNLRSHLQARGYGYDAD